MYLVLNNLHPAYVASGTDFLPGPLALSAAEAESIYCNPS